MRVREVRALGRIVAVREWGDPAGVPFLFWHALGPGHSGSSHSGSSFAVAARPLGNAGFRVLALDAPGFGRSAPAQDEDCRDRLVELLRAEGLDQPWTLDAWRDATRVEADGAVTVRASAEVRGAALHEAMRARPSKRWAVLAEARIPTLLVLAREPAEARVTNERLLPRFLEAVPQAEVARPGCRHQVFADLGADAGELVVSWLAGRNLP